MIEFLRKHRNLKRAVMILVAIIVILILAAAVAVVRSFSGGGSSVRLEATTKDCGGAVPSGGLVLLQASGFTPRGRIDLVTTRDNKQIKFAQSVPVNVLGQSWWFFGCKPGHDGQIKITATDRDTGKSTSTTFTVPEKLSR